MNDYRLGAAGLALIKRFEGFAAKAYLCPAGVWTIGYGHTKGVKAGDTCTEAEAEQFLRDDAGSAERPVKSLVRVPLNQNQFDALVSFTFNLGGGNLASSTLLRKLNSADYIGAALEFPRWNKAGGKVLQGLVRRRKAEADLFTGGP